MLYTFVKLWDGRCGNWKRRFYEMLDFLTWTAFGVFTIFALTIATFRIIEAREIVASGMFDVIATMEARRD